MKRGDLITVVVGGDYGKPRPALVIQSDHLTETDSVLVCLITSARQAAPATRLDLEAGERTELRQPSQIMVDKIVTARRDKCGAVIGEIDKATLANLGSLLSFAVGLAD